MRIVFGALMILTAQVGVVRADACFGPGVPLFHCTVQDGAKAVSVCLQGDVAYYRFGPPKGAAELLLARPVAGIDMRPWNGIGRSLFEEARFDNDGYGYAVHYAIDRQSAVRAVSGGVSVTRGEETLATLSCDEGRVSVADLYPLFEAKMAVGQCWSHETFRWERC